MPFPFFSYRTNGVTANTRHLFPVWNCTWEIVSIYNDTSRFLNDCCIFAIVYNTNLLSILRISITRGLDWGISSQVNKLVPIFLFKFQDKNFHIAFGIFYSFRRDTFSSKSVLGFYMKGILLCWGSATFFLAWIASIAFFTGSCYYICALFDDLKVQIDSFGGNILQKSNGRAYRFKQPHKMKKAVILHNDIIMWILGIFHPPRFVYYSLYSSVNNALI